MSTYSFKNAILNNASHFPNPVNNVLLKMNRFPGLIYGAKYMEYLKKLETEHYYEYDNTNDLLNMVNYVIDNTPYYADKYSKKIDSTEEFRSTFGFINKDIIMEDPSKFISKNIDFSKYDRVTTAGTSGKPLALYVPQSRYISELSNMHFLWKKAGFDYETRAVFRNHKFRDNDVYMINPITKEFYFNNYTLTNDYVKQAYVTIRNKGINILHGYTSGVYQFCLMCKEQGLDLSFIKVVLCASEGIQEFQRKLLVDELGLKLYNWYGHTEKLVLGGYCEHSDNYHMENRYGYFELIDDKGQPVTTAGEVGEIVGTTFMNKGMPFIRYRTGDYAEYVGNYCDKCKRHLPIIKNLQGRRDKNIIYKRDGTCLSTTCLNLHDELYDVINGFQYIQEEAGMLRVLIVKGDKFNDSHGDAFSKHYRKSMGVDSTVIIEYVDKLIYQPNGKFLLLISTLKQ